LIKYRGAIQIILVIVSGTLTAFLGYVLPCYPPLARGFYGDRSQIHRGNPKDFKTKPKWKQ